MLVCSSMICYLKASEAQNKSPGSKVLGWSYLAGEQAIFLGKISYHNGKIKWTKPWSLVVITVRKEKKTTIKIGRNFHELNALAQKHSAAAMFRCCFQYLWAGRLQQTLQNSCRGWGYKKTHTETQVSVLYWVHGLAMILAWNVIYNKGSIHEKRFSSEFLLTD